MSLINLIMRLAPLGIMGLLAGLIAQARLSLLDVLEKYILVVMSATLPVRLRCPTQNLGIDKLIARFVLPIGACVVQRAAGR